MSNGRGNIRFLVELVRWCFVLDVGSGVCEERQGLKRASDSYALLRM